MTYRKAYCKISKMMDKAFAIIDKQNKMIEDLRYGLKQADEHNRKLTAEISTTRDMNTENLRLLDSYIQTNARQAQDIIELESVAIALYDSLWHIVYSVEDEIQAKEVIETNAYKTVKALFEAEGEE